MSRAKWLADRRARGFDRPRPAVLRVANLGSVTFAAERSRRNYDRALETPGKFGRPHAIAACELADVDAKAAGSESWLTFQRGPIGSPDSALGMAARRGRVQMSHPSLHEGTARTREGGGIRRRPILAAIFLFDPRTPNAWACRIKIGHAPPKRAPKARAAYLRRFVAVPARIDCGDLNIGHRWAARLLGKRVYSAGVLHVAVPRWIPVRFSTVDIGSDHPAIDVLLWP